MKMTTFFLDEYKVRKLMVQNNYSMIETCKVCKLGKNTLYDAFSGKSVRKRTLFKLALGLGVKVEDLLKNNGDDKENEK